MPGLWRPSVDDRRAMRAFAAMVVDLNPYQMCLEVAGWGGTRDQRSMNMLWAKDPAAIPERLKWKILEKGVDLTHTNQAVVALYVVKLRGKTLSVMRVKVELVEGTPQMVRLAATGVTPVVGKTLQAFRLPKEHRALGTLAYQRIEMWKIRSGLRRDLSIFH